MADKQDGLIERHTRSIGRKARGREHFSLVCIYLQMSVHPGNLNQTPGSPIECRRRLRNAGRLRRPEIGIDD